MSVLLLALTIISFACNEALDEGERCACEEQYDGNDAPSPPRLKGDADEAAGSGEEQHDVADEQCAAAAEIDFKDVGLKVSSATSHASTSAICM